MSKTKTMKSTKAAPKAATNEEPGYRASPNAPTFEMAVASMEDAEFRHRGRGTKYAAVLERAKLLKPGQMLTLDVPEGQKAESMRNSLSPLLREHVKPHVDGAVECRILKTGQVAICVKKAE